MVLHSVGVGSDSPWATFCFPFQAQLLPQPPEVSYGVPPWLAARASLLSMDLSTSITLDRKIFSLTACRRGPA